MSKVIKKVRSLSSPAIINAKRSLTGYASACTRARARVSCEDNDNERDRGKVKRE